MGKSKETQGKKEIRTKQAKKRKDKEQRRQERKELGKQSFENMLAWVDENGVVCSSPPDLSNKAVIEAQNIEVGIPKSEPKDNKYGKTRKGTVKNFDSSKGYGFIIDSQNRNSVFVHASDCKQSIKAGDNVEFTVEKGLQGSKAAHVRIID